MRREGRPHGMVRTYHILPAPLNPKPASRIINPLDVPPTAGLFTKISNKPTNHSKFTGKCEKSRCSGCHFHPAWKSKDKSKGNQKLNTSTAAVDYRQVTWRVMGPNKLRNNGYSASGILDELNIHYHHHHDFPYDDDGDDEGVVDYSYNQGRREIMIETTTTTHHDEQNDDVKNDDVNDVKDDGDDDVVVDKEDDDDVIIHAGVTDDGDDGYFGFYDVACVMNHVDDEDDEGWSVVWDNQI